MVRGVEFFLNFFFYIILGTHSEPSQGTLPFPSGKKNPPPTHTYTHFALYLESFLLLLP